MGGSSLGDELLVPLTGRVGGLGHLGVALAHELDERLAGLVAHEVAGAHGQVRGRVAVALGRGVGRAHQKADGDLGVGAVGQALCGEKVARLVVGDRVGVMVGLGRKVERGVELGVGQAEPAGHAQGGGRGGALLGNEEVLGEVGEGAHEVARVARAGEDREGQREVLVGVTLDAVEVGEVEAPLAAHGVPADGLAQGGHGAVVVAVADGRKGEVAVEAVEGLAHVAQVARVALDAAVRQALEERGEAEPLDLVGRGAVAVDVLLGVLREAGEELLGLVGHALDEKGLAVGQLVGQVGVAHVSSSAPSAHVVCQAARGRRGCRLQQSLAYPAHARAMRPPRNAHGLGGCGGRWRRRGA